MSARGAMLTGCPEPGLGTALARPARVARLRPRCRTLLGVQVVGTGSYVPDEVVTNEHLQEQCGFDPDWILQRTGIRARRRALPQQATSDLCAAAAQRCIAQAGVDPQDIDLLLLATFTPDMAFPATACLVQERLGLCCAAVDLQAACAGFMYALITGASYVVSGASDLALIVAGDCNSRILNPQDRNTYPLFGDGSGAVLLARGDPQQGLLSYSLGADGRGAGLLSRPAGGSRLPPTPELLAEGKHYLQMDGRAVFRWAVGIVVDTIRDVLAASELRPADVDLFIPHQANIRIIQAALAELGLAPERAFTNLERYGNTSAGSVPLALDEAVAVGRIGSGGRVLLSGFGAGLAWGTALVQW